MSCMPRRELRGAPSCMQVQTYVVRPSTPYDVGSISCHPVGLEPISFAWSSADGATVETDPTRSEATRLPPGEYRCSIVDGTQTRADVLVLLRPVHEKAVVIDGYDVQHCTGTLHRDGRVTVRGSGLESLRLLWSNGVTTAAPVLEDVGEGTYVAVPLAEEGTPLFHRCGPAVVRVRPRG